MAETITKVSWLRKGNGKKVGKREEAYFKSGSAVRFAKGLENEPGVSDIRLEIDLGFRDVR